MHQLLTSVIVPVYNGERHIAEAVHSILAQTVPPAEIIVVDDGSTDGSVAAVPVSSRVRIERRPHAGIAATVNHGVSVARGDCLAFLDADDRWLPHKLERQLPCLLAAPAADVVFSLTRIFHDPPAPGASDEGSVINGTGKSSLLVRRATFDRIGLFPAEPGMHDFIGWYARVAELGLRTHVVNEVLFERRVHGANDGIVNRDRQRASYFGTLRHLLARRRGNGQP